MPGLVNRYHISTEYADLLSTSPTHRSGPKSSASRTHRLRTAAQDEAASWYSAAVPSLDDLRTVLRRVHDDPDVTRERVFGGIWPLLVFGTLFVVVVVALQPGSALHHLAAAPREHQRQCWKLAGALFGSITAAVLILRTIVWCVAEGTAVFVGKASRQANRHVTQSLPSSNALLGALFVEGRQK